MKNTPANTPASTAASTTSISSPRTSRLAGMMATLAAFGLAGGSSVHADDFYWGTTASNADWATATNWFEDAGGTTAASSAPGADDQAIFNITSLNATATSVRLFADTVVNGLTFNRTAALSFTSNSSSRTLTVGAGGITKNGASSAFDLGSSNGNESFEVLVSATQAWNNNAAGLLRIRNGVTAANDAGAVVLTLNAASTSGIQIQNALSDGTGSTLGIVVDSAGTGVNSTVSIGDSAYSGGTLVRRGVLSANGGGIGTAAIQLGDTSGSADATLRINTTSAVTTGLNVQAGNTGVNVLEFAANNAAGGTYDGDITLNNTLNVGVRNVASGAIINGDISGTGDLVKGQYQGGASGVLNLAGNNTYTGDTVINDGAFTLVEGAALTFLIGADGINNSVHGTSSGAVTFSGTFSFNLSGAGTTDGDSWLIVDGSSFAESFTSTFDVAGFSETALDSGIWTLGGYTFTESTGQLSFSGASIPEPSAAAVLVGMGALGFCALRRRRAV